MNSITANLIDILNRRIFPARIDFGGGKIINISQIDRAEGYILPGFIDSHIHIESSMLIPSVFARVAVKHGTVATVSDPHEIGNVLGLEGVEFMINNGNKVPFKFNFGAPSCVPATTFESAGAEIDTGDIEKMLGRPEIKYLSEMMNWPGVVNDDPNVLKKIAISKKFGKPVDGHAPGLVGELAEKYIAAGISTDHECTSYDEAVGKIRLGMKISIREGSAARNFEALAPLIDEYPDMIMLCSDDKHPDELILGHINQLVTRALAKNLDLFNILKAACINPVKHYGLDIGLLEPGDPADFIIVNNITEFKVLQTFINGQEVAKNGESFIPEIPESPINKFNIDEIDSKDLNISASTGTIRVIEAMDGQLLTNERIEKARITNGNLVTDTKRDLLKLVVVNRYRKAKPAVAIIKNFGLKKGALASSIGHDSHNITAVGVDDESIASAINLVIRAKGGISAFSDGQEHLLPLPYAGLMTDLDGYMIAEQYTAIDKFVKNLGSSLRAPFMTLSFMALLVIPDLKLSDLGLFSGQKFKFVDLFIKEG